MKTMTIKIMIVFASILSISNLINAQTKISKSDSTLFVSLVAQYAKSIDEADTVLGSKLWAHTSEVSFINPSGNEYGWNGIKNIYNLFRDNFSARKLSFFNLKTAVYDDVAWVEFFWVFDARINNNSVQTKGRETQIWREINNEWRLVHVHYSGMPATGQGQDF